MGAESVGLREMVMTMSRLANTVNRKMNKKTTKNIFCRCGFCVSPKRTNSATLLGGLRKPIQQVISSWACITYKEYRMILVNHESIGIWLSQNKNSAVTVTVEHILGNLPQFSFQVFLTFFHDASHFFKHSELVTCNNIWCYNLPGQHLML